MASTQDLIWFAIPLALGLLGVGVASFARRPAWRRRTVTGVAVGLVTALFAFVLFVTTLGSGIRLSLTTTGPVVLVAAVLLVLALRRTDWALWLLVGLGVVELSAGVWSFVDPAGFSDAFDDAGYAGASALVAIVAVPLVAAVAGIRRPRAAGLLVVGFASLLVVIQGLQIRVLSGPLMVAGVLLLLAGWERFVGRRARDDAPEVAPTGGERSSAGG